MVILDKKVSILFAELLELFHIIPMLKPGKILRINVDSTYDILFDSGERELRINEGEIKLLSSSSGSSLGGGMGSLGELQEIEESEEDDDSGW